MGLTFFGRVDVGILGSPMGPLGLPGLISQFTLFKEKAEIGVVVRNELGQVMGLLVEKN